MAILAEVPCYGKKVNNALRNIEAQKAANWMMRRKKSLKVWASPPHLFGCDPSIERSIPAVHIKEEKIRYCQSPMGTTVNQIRSTEEIAFNLKAWTTFTIKSERIPVVEEVLIKI
ncbi:hypothetical protein FH972_025317 [Carpinus fangiana]|uniref:Uncharacterized protein n=1 Tax=Carpinus fangiana TaxID=176857 RepID=A0A5N6L1A2_9ROSI|nr:hypothetical protein FH972_025317 [Carpinus fangiana]